ncbi:hypothetical protein BDQ12DRAFT_718380 [Crucibulum laeve]|uniref:60S ribosomal protein L29 n=1 Tax=Crucibulum laeve TaxID=68775 RepID=A0A5C3MFD0_9AGAR|nr:hypothetical protein BDQ12DRAFT_718380 [Crucibulum laeve]
MSGGKIHESTSPAVEQAVPVVIAILHNNGQIKKNKKAHRNGLKKPAATRTRSLKGARPFVDAKFRRNARFALAGSNKARLEAKQAAAAS